MLHKKKLPSLVFAIVFASLFLNNFLIIKAQDYSFKRELSSDYAATVPSKEGIWKRMYREIPDSNMYIYEETRKGIKCVFRYIPPKYWDVIFYNKKGEVLDKVYYLGESGKNIGKWSDRVDLKNNIIEFRCAKPGSVFNYSRPYVIFNFDLSKPNYVERNLYYINFMDFLALNEKTEKEKIRKEQEELARIEAEKKQKEQEKLARIEAEKKQKEQEQLAHVNSAKEIDQKYVGMVFQGEGSILALNDDGGAAFLGLLMGAQMTQNLRVTFLPGGKVNVRETDTNAKSSDPRKISDSQILASAMNSQSGTTYDAFLEGDKIILSKDLYIIISKDKKYLEIHGMSASYRLKRI